MPGEHHLIPDTLLVTSSHVRKNTSSSHIGTVTHLDCPTGSVLDGDNDIECRDDGNTPPLIIMFILTSGSWSLAPVPRCELVTCPPLEVASRHLRLLTLNNSFLGAATFSCPLGYSLSPSISSIWCDHTGAWSAPLPSCQIVR